MEFKEVRLNRLSLLTTTLAFVSLCSAAPVTIYTPTSGTLTGSILTNFSTFSEVDVRGVTVGLLNGTIPTFLYDPVNGSDPTFTSLPFGNLIITAFAGGEEAVGLQFSDTPLLLNESALVLAVTGGFLSTGTSLASLTYPGLTATFSFLSSGQVSEGISLLQYSLVSVDVEVPDQGIPEPATVAFVGAGLAGLLVFRKRCGA